LNLKKKKKILKTIANARYENKYKELKDEAQLHEEEYSNRLN
jgi:hypothetical protein